MLVLSPIKIDLRKQTLREAVYAVQNDSNTRGLELTLVEGESPWNIPTGTTAAISFRKPDGTSGLYDTLPDGVTKAVEIAQNKVTAIFAPQVLTCPGRVDVSLILFDSLMNRLGTFPIPVFVSEDPSAGQGISNDYYNFQTLEELNKALGGHIHDKNNPHSVTAEQVGARPSDWMPSASDVKARPNTWMPSASDVGASPMEYTKKVGNPHNLLDNSDFRNPVNQKGKNSYVGGEHTIDRWFLPVEGTLIVNSGFVTLSNNFFVQRVESNKLTSDKYTIGFMLKTGLCMGMVDISSAVIGSSFTAYSDGSIGVYLYRESESVWQVYIHCGIAIDLLYAFMYEGEYTAETLPEYQPKGYAVELLVCQTQLQRFRTETERKTYCEDFRPTMRMTPNGEVSKFEHTVDGIMYYFASAEL